jgi:translocation and assembly module TamA
MWPRRSRRRNLSLRLPPPLEDDITPPQRYSRLRGATGTLRLSRSGRLVLTLLAAAPAFSAPLVGRAEPRAAIVGTLDRALRAELTPAVGEVKTPPATPAEARRRARDAAVDVSALLRSEGYYEADVTPDVGDGPTPKSIVKVVPGPRFVFKDPTIDWVGAEPPFPVNLDAKLSLSLVPGAPGRATDVLAAEARAVTALHKDGYADAEAQPRKVVVDHADKSVQPTFNLAAHDLVRMGAVRLSGRTRTKQYFVRRLAPWKPGDIYDPVKVAKLEQRLIDANVYDGVTVTLAPPAAVAGAAGSGVRRAVLVRLDDRKPHTLELGAGYSTTQGSGVDGRFVLYNRLGRGDSLIFIGRLYDIQQKLDAELDLPDFLRADQILKAGGGFLAERTSAYNDLGGGVRANVERHYSKTTYISLGAAFDYATTKEKTAINTQATPVGETLHLFIPTLLAGFALDRSNDPLNPVRGFRIDAHVEPTYIFGDRNLAYLKGVAQGSVYLPLDPHADTVIAGRLRLGTILGGSIPNVPADRRFYAGGGGSVRGYGYQDIGPRLADNTPQGGLSLAEVGFEVRRHIVGKFSGVAFVDAGAVGTGPTPGFTGYGLGAGLGVRYDLGFAPLRIDIGTPIKRQPGDALVQIYISLGQSF